MNEERQKLEKETREYLRCSSDRDVYLCSPISQDAIKDLARCVMRQRGWHHGLSSYEEVLQVVTDVVKSESRIDSNQALVGTLRFTQR
jgi:hypothetical protein